MRWLTRRMLSNDLLPGCPWPWLPASRPTAGRRFMVRESIVEAVKRDGRSIAAIARASGVARQVLSPYLAGKCTITAETLDRVMHELGLQITQNPAKP